jgi:NAD(P)-dependent dehydrogenase (short-subunit alcohol dehydrogenase family)
MTQPELQGDGRDAYRILEETALIVGVGPGFGFALARRLAATGMRVALASRNAERLDCLVAEIARAGGTARAYGCNATDERSIARLMSRVSSDFTIPSLVVYAVQSFCPGRVLEVEVAAFEESWRHNCLGGFIVAREAGRAMAPAGRGTIILTGSTSSLIGRADHLNLAVGRFGLRALAQVLAREVWPTGIHVAHVVIDADIQENVLGTDEYPQAAPEHLAEAVLTLHRQPRTAWTSEIDFRPWNEKFWEHC